MTRYSRLTAVLPLIAAITALPVAHAQSPALPWKRIPHPRLYLSTGKIADLKKGLYTAYAVPWSEVQKRADAIAATHPPAYSENRDLSSDELWWEMDVAARLPSLALAYVATGEKKYFNAAGVSRPRQGGIPQIGQSVDACGFRCEICSKPFEES